MPEFSSIPSMITECFERDESRDKQWYKRYQNTHERVLTSPLSDETLSLLWFERDNSVASLKQGNTSKEEFEQAKATLRELTQTIISSPTSETYEHAVKTLQKLKDEGVFRFYYGALLNRVFGAIVPKKVTSCVKDDSFMQAANFINQHFKLGLSLQGNWFEKSSELKQALRQHLPDDIDDFKVNIAIWNVFELLEQEKNGLDDTIIEAELNAQKVVPLDLTVEQYKQVLNAEGLITERELRLLSVLHQRPDSKATSPQLSQLLAYEKGTGANLTIGHLSKKIAKFFDIEKADIKNKYTGWWQLVANGERLDTGFTWQLKNNLKIAMTELRLVNTEAVAVVQEESSAYKNMPPLNQIFYGPPGTGKTYITTEAAVKAAIPGYVIQSRDKLKADYDELVRQKRIQFVTFHQSYGYEEFVEGLRAVTEDGQVRYEIKPGIFKRLCTAAISNINKAQHVTAGGFDACWELFLEQFDDEKGATIQTKKSSFKITEISETTIHFEKAQGDSKHSLAISTLKEVFNQTRVIKGGLNVYYQPLVEHLTRLAASINASNEPIKNYVLIIDEINRGNISKIFGELITLIEESKRSFGNTTETAEVTLPYSGDPFSVPSNVFIIGTMNTADRSLAMMDTALRRRFDFTEMMPKPDLFKNLTVKGIDVEKLLSTLNQRIEALYDREHMLGHAFLMPVKAALDNGNEPLAFSLLKQVFLNKFIPLLEEYFFDDWNKIRLILGDHRKSDLGLQFIQTKSQSYDDLFGEGHRLDSYEQQALSYHLASPEAEVWENAKAYQSIYSVEADVE